MITGVEHIALFSGNPEALRDWYARVFAFRIVKENETKRTYWLQAADGMLFELKKEQQKPTDDGDKVGGLRHVALTTDHFEETVAQLMKEQVEIVMNPTISATGGKTFFFRDPDGNIFQLIARSQPFFS